MSSLQFKAVIKVRGVNPYVDVSAKNASLLQPGWRKPMPVMARINGKPSETWKINLMPAGNGEFFLYLHGTLGKVRKASRVTG